MAVIDRGRIAKNTVMLYFRMGIMMLISLYTSRVVLDALGEFDFGVYSAVGGIVAMFSFLSGAMSGACQRFYLMEMGRDDFEQLKKVFSLCLLVFCAFAVIVLLITEPAGLWFMHHKMKVGPRVEAANWVLHCSILSFMAVVIRLPYQGMVVAKEKMKVFAYISIIEVLCALGVALLLKASGGDLLIEYAYLMLAAQVIVTLLYIGYCLRFYPECRYNYYWDGSKFREIFSFAGWNLIGSSASVFKIHGVNILLNMFFGPVVNAARGLAFKVYSVVTQLQENFMTASKPQIIKAYSAGEFEGMRKLVYQTSKFSAYLMLSASIPLMLEMPFLLDIWLKDVPELTALFAVIMLANGIVDTIDTPVWVVIQAVGKMRNYQLVVGGLQLLVLPLAYLMLKSMSVPPQSVLYLTLAISAAAVAARLFFASSLAGLRPMDFVTKALLPALAVGAAALGAGFAVHSAMEQGWLRLFAVTAVSVAVEGLAIYAFGLTRKERSTIMNKFKEKIGK